MAQLALVREHLRAHVTHLKRAGGPRAVLDDLRGARSIALLDPLATRYRVEYAGGRAPERLKILELSEPREGSRPEAEAFAWTYLALPSGRRDGRPIPALREGFARPLGDLANFAPFADATLFEGADTVALRDELLRADPGDMQSPELTESYAERVKIAEEEDVNELPIPSDSDSNPNVVAWEAAENAREKPALIVLRVGEGERSARVALLEGPRPVESVQNLLVQTLGTLRALRDEAGFVLGGFDLDDVSHDAIPRSTSEQALLYATPEGDALAVARGGAAGFPLFRFRDLGSAILSDTVSAGVSSFGWMRPGQKKNVAWAREWRVDVERARSHALDLHALGLNVISAVAQRVAARRDAASARDELWDAAKFCFNRLILGKKDVAKDAILRRAFAKDYAIDAGKLWRVYRAALRKVLSRARADVGDSALSEAVFATYDVGSEESALSFSDPSEPHAVLMASALTSRPDEVAGVPILEDLLIFDPSVDIEVAEPARLDWWTSSYFSASLRRTRKHLRGK